MLWTRVPSSRRGCWFFSHSKRKTEVFLGLKILGVFTAGCGIVCSCSICEQYSPLSLSY